MKILVPLVIALLGLGAGVAAGLALKPAPEPEPVETAAACPEAAAEPCAPDPFAPPPKAERKHGEELIYVSMDKPFVVPVFAKERVAAMVVVSLSVETDMTGGSAVEALKPRLRDSFLKVMFRHANTGGFDGSFTSGRQMEDLKAALLAAARKVAGAAPVTEILVTEIARQDA